MSFGRFLPWGPIVRMYDISELTTFYGPYPIVQCLKFKSFSLGIDVTLNNMPDNGVILVVTDAGTHQRDLEESIKKKAAEKNIKIFIAFYPRCKSSRFCSESMPSYESVSEGRIFDQSDFDNEKFFKSVLNTVRNIYLSRDDVCNELLKNEA